MTAYESNQSPAASNPMIASIAMKVLISMGGDFDVIVESLNLCDGTANAVVFQNHHFGIINALEKFHEPIFIGAHRIHVIDAEEVALANLCAIDPNGIVCHFQVHFSTPSFS